MIHTPLIKTLITAANKENKGASKSTLIEAVENKRIIAYSLKKISTKPTESYSILNPDTNSDSPSEKSKGVRFVSAKSITNHITLRIGNVTPL